MQLGRAVLVVFEGLDGSGKTTAAQVTAGALQARFMTTPPPSVRSFRDSLISSFNGSQEAAQLFYLATVFAAADEIRRSLAGGTSVVVDRYFLSTQAYAAFRGSTLGLDSLGDLLVPADLTVVLEAPLEVRKARLELRGQTTSDRETTAVEANARLLELHAARFSLSVCGRLIRLDTSKLSPAAVATQVVEELAGFGLTSVRQW